MYKPKQSTIDKIPEIEKLYYIEKLTITQISEHLQMSFGTISNVLTHQLHGKFTKSEISKRSFTKLTEQQKKRFVEASIKKRTNNEKYIQKISKTKQGVQNPAARLNEEMVREIRDAYENMLSRGSQKTAAQKILADIYGVKRPTISDIVLRKTWKHI